MRLRRTCNEKSHTPGSRSARLQMLLPLLCALLPVTEAVHHMKRPPRALVNRENDNRPLMISNQCPEVIYPGVGTQAGVGPPVGGFRLGPGETRNFTVSGDWQGRVWGRTNCTFNADGTGPDHSGGNNGGGAACGTGDCGGVVNCKGTGATPVTLAEFTLSSDSHQAFYDISLVDGYNIPLAIISLYPESDNPSLAEIPPNLTNPICIGTASLLAAPGSVADQYLGSNKTYPLPLEQTITLDYVARWCPWDLQVSPPEKPGDGIYPYPDDNILRPFFDPCFSACAKNNQPEDCCTGAYDSPGACSPGIYSQHAKAICPDAYSYAFDDQTSTFILPEGGGFGVVFCPPGRSTTILSSLGPQLRDWASRGVTPQLLQQLQNETLIQQQAAGGAPRDKRWGVSWLVGMVGLIGLYNV